MTTRKTVLLTGGTGFLGAFLLDDFLRRGCRVMAIVRGPEGERRLLDALRDIDSDADETVLADGQLRVFNGDVRAPGFGVDAAAQRLLVNSVKEIWHCAASFKFQERCCEEVAAHNITGTRNVLDFAYACNLRRLTPMFHISTAYAAPLINGLVREELPTSVTPFRNRYEWSKQEAERLIGEFRRQYHVPAYIFRPSIIIGHSRTGRAARFTGYYDVIRALYLLAQSLSVNLGDNFDRDLRLRILAGDFVRLNVAPVDFVVEAMTRLAARVSRQDAWIFNITNDHPPLLDFLFAQACVPLAVTGIQLVNAAAFQRQPMSGLERIFNRKTQFQAPYLLDGPLFDSSKFRALVPERLLPCPQADEALMRRVNEYYYHGVLDRQFGKEQKAASASAFLPTLPMLSSAVEVEHHPN